MRIAILSDVHANLPAVGYAPSPNETLERLQREASDLPHEFAAQLREARGYR